MRRISPLQPVACSEFVLHVITDQVGVVTSACTTGIETYKTIRLANGEVLTAPVGGLRPATDAEIKKRHREAASVRPLLLPTLTAIQSRHFSQPSVAGESTL